MATIFMSNTVASSDLSISSLSPDENLQEKSENCNKPTLTQTESFTNPVSATSYPAHTLSPSTTDLIRFSELGISGDLNLQDWSRLEKELVDMDKNHTSEAETPRNSDVELPVGYDPRTAIKPLEGWRLQVVVFIDAIGRKSAILISWFLFAVFSLASGLATTLTQLIIFRSFQGIGGSGLFTMAMTVAPQVSPARLWGLLSGCLGAALACSSLVGPVLGGVITERAGWRWIYLFNAPVAALIVIPLHLAWPKSPQLNKGARNLLLSQVDVPGALLLLAASTLLVFALEQGGGYRNTWNSGPVVASLVVSAVCWILFFSWIIFLESDRCKINIKPIFPLRTSMARPTGPAILMAFLAGFPFFIIIINIPIRYQLLNGDTPTMAGIHLLSLLALSAAGSALGGALSINKNRTCITLIMASILTCLGTGLLSTAPNSRSIEPIQFFYQALLGLGLGLSVSSITIMTGLASDLESVASVNGAINQARVLGGSIGLSTANILLNSKIGSELKSVLSPTELQNLRQSISTIINLTPIQQAKTIGVFAHSFNSQMRICLYLSVISVFVALFTWQKNPASVQAHKEKQSALSSAHNDVP
ncbi:Bgt-1520 [Blumeria graminis f. sp. tritici]|uniref:Bgt-1520 n=2 Tax=Blumeria graminis f. sp. tritici TaxID=62690 RepID=A0A061HDT8_BLUGR|nr:transporter of the Major Facilitator Superfamily [Blumeria graminis f. sp. tritici 96224]VDB96388.1 Bgt-1520 [Blumeria graminis f. sp. tritici]